jgi:tetratricopeptide (TPR) repeat protein
MIRLVSAAFLAAFALAPIAQAEPYGPPPPLSGRAVAELSLDELFAKLRDDTTAKSPAGERIEKEILRRFDRSGSPTVDLLMSWATDAMKKKDLAKALDVLDQMLVLKPDYAEAWNKRAAVYYMMDEYGDSLSDIRATLALEPRHFGALVGFGMILESMDRNAEAIRVYKRALEINPRLDKVRESLEALEKTAEGSSI